VNEFIGVGVGLSVGDGVKTGVGVGVDDGSSVGVEEGITGVGEAGIGVTVDRGASGCGVEVGVYVRVATLGTQRYCPVMITSLSKQLVCLSNHAVTPYKPPIRVRVSPRWTR